MTGFFTTTSINREVLLWAVATRTQLDRWEPLVAAHVSRNLATPKDMTDADVWRMQYERVFCLVAARSLFHALDLLDPPVTIDETLRNEIIEARDLT